MFKKGQVSNPKGRPPGLNHKQKMLSEMLLKHVPDACRVVNECLADPDYKLAAAKEIFDRVFGKAPQAVELSGPEGGAIKLVIE